MTYFKNIGLVLVGLALGGLGALALHGQEGMQRVELARAGLSGAAGTEVVMATLEVPPGTHVPRHIHPGDEFAYILTSGSFQAPGKDPVTLQADTPLHFPRDVPHGGFEIVGDAPVKLLTVHIVDKGKPMTALVE